MTITTRPGQASFTQQRAGTALVLKHLSAEVWENHGEAYVDEAHLARTFLRKAEEAAQGRAGSYSYGEEYG